MIRPGPRISYREGGPRGNTISNVMYVDAPDAGLKEGLSVLDPIDVRYADEVTVEGNTITDVGVSPEPAT